MSWESVGPVIGLEPLSALLGLGVRSIERMLADGSFPIEPLPFVGAGRKRRILRWSTSEVRAWVETRKTARRPLSLGSGRGSR